MAPGQVFGFEGEEEIKEPKGMAIIFHPDLLRGTALGRQMKEYTFFNYEVNEALHLSSREREVINECINNINYELQHAIDKHSKTLIVSYLELFFKLL